MNKASIRLGYYAARPTLAFFDEGGNPVGHYILGEYWTYPTFSGDLEDGVTITMEDLLEAMQLLKEQRDE